MICSHADRWLPRRNCRRNSTPEAKPVTIAVDDAIRVSGLLQAPKDARACYVLAHGAGAGMKHAFMAAVAAELAERGIATLRYQFPYMEKGGKRPDPPKLAHAAVRAAVAEAARLVPKLPLIAGGKSFGGRMTSQAQAVAPLPGVRGLAFLGFPLHPAGQPVAGARRASVRRANSDAVPARLARSACDARSDRAGVQSARRRARRWKFFPMPIIPSTCRPRPAARTREVRGEVLEPARRLDRRRDRVQRLDRHTPVTNDHLFARPSR